MKKWMTPEVEELEINETACDPKKPVDPCCKDPNCQYHGKKTSETPVDLLSGAVEAE